MASTSDQSPGVIPNSGIDGEHSRDGNGEQPGATVPPASSVTSALVNSPGTVKLPVMMGRYRIEKELGRGAMGAVFLAHDSELDRPVALKVPKFSGEENPELIARFLREARSAAVLAHPNICRVYDVNEHQGVRYIAMEYIEGKPLSAFIAAGSVQPKQAATVIRKLALGLAEAHARGIIHRDLKPDNILVNKNGEPVLTDFGLARASASHGPATATQDGVILGSPAYMPPEQAAGNLSDMGPTSDIYSLGVVLYELLTGEIPFRGSVVEVLAHVLTKTPKPVREVKPEIEAGLAAICDKMMAKKAADRYQSMNDVANALNEWLKAASSSKPAADGAAAKSKLGTPHVVQPKKPGESPANQSIAPLSLPANRQTISPKTTKPGDGVAGTKSPAAASKVSERTPKQLKELAELVEQLLARNDYLEAIPMLEAIPDYQRTQQLRTLLGEAFELKATVEKLERQLEKHLNLLEIPELKKTVDKLLKIHPSHPRGKEIRKALNTEGKKGVVQILKDEGNYHGGGFEWEWWQIGAAVGTICLLFGVVSYAVFVYIKGATGTLEIRIDDPTAVVKIDGNKATINATGTGEMRIAYGIHGYTVEQGGTTVVTNGQYEFKKDGNKVLTITLKKPAESVAGTTTPDTPPAGDAPPPAVAPFDATKAKAHQEAWAKHLGVPVEYTNSIGMKFRLIPPGDYLVGMTQAEVDAHIKARGDDFGMAERFRNSTPQHTVTLKKPYYLGVYEVTQKEFETVTGRNPAYMSPVGGGKNDVAGQDRSTAPVEYLTWADCAEFCAKLSTREKLSPTYQRNGSEAQILPGNGYRLPTEAEWEAACRGGASTVFSFGDALTDFPNYGWSAVDLVKNPAKIAHPVGQLRSNPFGLYDMHGNVWEWCQDFFDPNSYQEIGAAAVVDPTGPAIGTLHCFRGGGLSFDTEFHRSGLRHGNNGDAVDHNIGFRVMLPVDAVKDTSPQVAQSSWQPGYLAQIYEGIGFDRLLKTRVDDRIDTNFGDGPAEKGLPVDNFSIRWLGAVEVKQAGKYTIRFEHDDGGRLWIDDQLLIDKWEGGIHGDEQDVTLVAGWHTLRLEYYDGIGTAGINLRWKLPGQELSYIAGESVQHNPEWAKRAEYTKLGTPDGPTPTEPLIVDEFASLRRATEDIKPGEMRGWSFNRHQLNSIPDEQDSGFPITLEKSARAKMKLASLLEGNTANLQNQASLEVSVLGDFAASQPFSLGIWSKPRTSHHGALIAKFEGEGTAAGYALEFNQGQFGITLVSDWGAAGGPFAIETYSKEKFRENEWHHAVMTYDGSKKAAGVKLFIDGKLKPLAHRIDRLKGDIRNSQPLRIGGRNVAQHFDGWLAEPRVYAKALTPAEVKREFEQTPKPDVNALAPDAGDANAASMDEVRSTLRELIQAGCHVGIIVDGQNIGPISLEQIPKKPFRVNGFNLGVQLDRPAFQRIAPKIFRAPIMETLVDYFQEHSSITSRDLIGLNECGNLQALRLSKTGIDDGLLRQLHNWPKLTDLRVQETRVTAASMANVGQLSKLVILEWNDSATDESLSELKGMSELTYLTLSGKKLRGTGLKHLANHLRLTHLNLTGQSIDDEGIRNLPPLPKLSWLNLSNTRLGNGAIAHLKTYQTMEQLNLSGTKVTNAAIPELITMKTMTALAVNGSKIDAAGVEQLREGLPGCQIIGP